MDKKAIWKWLLLVVLVTAALVTVLPVKDKVRLGLDLQGGTSFVVQIDDDAIVAQIREENKELSDAAVAAKLAERIKDAQSRALEVIRNRVDNLGIAEPIIYPEKGNRIVVQLPGVDEKKRKEAELAIQSAAFLEFRLVHEDNQRLVDKMFDKGQAPEGFIIASVDDRGARRNYLKRDEKTVPDSAMDQAFREKLGRFQAPHGYELLFEKQKIGSQTVYSPYFVDRRRQLTGDTLADASVDYRSLGQPVVKIQFDPAGARRFGTVTSDYGPGGAKNPNPQQGRQLAIVLDGTLYSAPVIREAIRGGRAEISGSFTVSEAAFLSNILRAGALPAPVKVVEKRTVDPTLGSDSIRSGVRAVVIGSLAVLIFMAAFYLFSGLVANATLVLNMVLLPLAMVIVAGTLGMFAKDARAGSAIALPVLTLPGIAGILLSIGMAVDANVLIFERIREELGAAKGFMAAVQAGFTRAFTAIFDSNMTTIITAVILFILGSGPVRGYAITLIAGLIVNLYTAVVVARMCFNGVAAKSTNMGLLKMRSVIKETHLDFIRWWKPALSISIMVIVVSWAVMVMHGRKNASSVFGVDFTGGSSLTLSFQTKVNVEEVRAALEAAGISDAAIQYQKEIDSDREVLQVKSSKGGDSILPIIGSGGTNAAAVARATGQVEKVLTETFASAGFKVLQEDDVGPAVGAELKRKASWAMLWSLIAMILYISWRFEFGFALGAVVALFHDVLITAGVCHLLGLQMNMTIVAALMTIVGYSVNDTIVIFDRIRENLRMVRNKSFTDVCNLGLNQTLSRTLLTNSLTFMTVVALLIFGGGAIKDFSIAMFIGMIAGTYSTVYIATPVTLLWYRFKTPDLGTASAR